MQYIKIENFPFEVSRIGLGAWAIGGKQWGGTDEKDSVDTILKAFDKGINLVDTAPAYGDGLSERMVGKALKTFGRREKVIISTKCGLTTEKGEVFRDASKEAILKGFEESLRNLGTDYIDIYFVHWPDFLVPFTETAEVMLKLFEKGKIKAIGVSNFSVKDMDEFQKRSPIHILQSPFNIFENEIEKEEMPYCLKNNIAIFGYGALCRGLLTGKMKKNKTFEGDDIRTLDPKFKEPVYSEYLACVEKLSSLASKKYNKTILALAIRYVLDKKVSVALWGARQPRQLDEIESAFEWKLKEEDLKEIDEVVKESVIHPFGPQFMAPPLHPLNFI